MQTHGAQDSGAGLPSGKGRGRTHLGDGVKLDERLPELLAARTADRAKVDAALRWKGLTHFLKSQCPRTFTMQGHYREYF
jgi:hypothetical protein